MKKSSYINGAVQGFEPFAPEARLHTDGLSRLHTDGLYGTVGYEGFFASDSAVVFGQGNAPGIGSTRLDPLQVTFLQDAEGNGVVLSEDIIPGHDVLGSGPGPTIDSEASSGFPTRSVADLPDTPAPPGYQNHGTGGFNAETGAIEATSHNYNAETGLWDLYLYNPETGLWDQYPGQGEAEVLVPYHRPDPAVADADADTSSGFPTRSVADLPDTPAPPGYQNHGTGGFNAETGAIEATSHNYNAETGLWDLYLYNPETGLWDQYPGQGEAEVLVPYHRPDPAFADADADTSVFAVTYPNSGVSNSITDADLGISHDGFLL